MHSISQKQLNSWHISYNPHMDLFQIYDKEVFHLPDKDIQQVKSGLVTFLYQKETNNPLMIEIYNAFQHIGDIDKMSKKDIIQGVIRYANTNG